MKPISPERIVPDLRFAELLAELRAEDCVHSWRDLPGNPARLLAAENKRRPTTVFGYYRGGVLLAAAAVADGLGHGSAPGFPVLARGYVRPAFRGLGLYKAMVRHRLEHCRKTFGAALRAVHLGSSDRRVWRALRSVRGFRPIGWEALPVAGRMHAVRDWLWLEARFAARLRAEATGTLRAPIRRLLAAGWGRRDYGLLKNRLDSSSPPAVAELARFAAEVPLLVEP